MVYNAFRAGLVFLFFYDKLMNEIEKKMSTQQTIKPEEKMSQRHSSCAVCVICKADGGGRNVS